MRLFLFGIIASLFAGVATAQSFNPAEIVFPWKNGPTRDAQIDLGTYKNTVFVFEAFANFCGACNDNVSNVESFVSEYAADERVAIFDLGLDTSSREIDRWVARHNPNHPVVQDVDEKVWGALSSANYIPQAFVTTCAGDLVFSHVGTWTSSVKTDLRNAIAEAKQTICD